MEVERKNTGTCGVEGLSAILGNIFYNLQHIHLGEHLWYKMELRHKWEGAETPPTDLQSGFSQVFGQRSGELALSMATTEKSPCRRVAYNRPSSPTWQLLFLSVHHGSNPAIPCDPHISGKRGGRMTSCLPLDSEVEGAHKEHEWGLQSLKEEVNVFIDGAGGKVGSSAGGVSRIKSRVALKEL